MREVYNTEHATRERIPGLMLVDNLLHYFVYEEGEIFTNEEIVKSVVMTREGLDEYNSFSMLYNSLSFALGEINSNNKTYTRLANLMTYSFNMAEIHGEDAVYSVFVAYMTLIEGAIEHYSKMVLFCKIIQALDELFCLIAAKEFLSLMEYNLTAMTNAFDYYNERLEKYKDYKFYEYIKPVERKKPLYAKDYRRLKKILLNTADYRTPYNTLFNPILKAINVDNNLLDEEAFQARLKIREKEKRQMEREIKRLEKEREEFEKEKRGE